MHFKEGVGAMHLAAHLNIFVHIAKKRLTEPMIATKKGLRTSLIDLLHRASRRIAYGKVKTKDSQMDLLNNYKELR